MSDSHNEGLPILVAFLTGAVIGAGVGLLLAPKPGKETRAQLADFARRTRERASDLAARLRHDKAAEGSTADA